MTPTRIRTLVLIALVLVAVGWAVVALVDRLNQRLLPVPWTAAVALALITLGLLVAGACWPSRSCSASPAARGSIRWWRPGRRRSRWPPRAPGPPSPASTGASRSASWIRWIPQPDASYAAAAGAAVLASIALSGVGLWLESICRLPGDGDDQPGKGPGQASNQGGHSTA